MALKIALVRQRCEKGALPANVESTLEAIRAAAAQGVDVIAFPEANLTGYVEVGRYPDVPVSLDSAPIRRLIGATEGLQVTALTGLVERHGEGGLPYLTQLVIRDGRLLGIYRKVTIVDEEAACFTPGQGVPIFNHLDMPFGIAICADIGNAEVFAAAARQGARIVFEVAAPGLYGEQATRNWQSGYDWWESECNKYLAGYAAEHGIWVAVATQAGRTIDEDFPGGAYVFAPNGQRTYATIDWQPGTSALALDLEAGTTTPLA